MDLTSLSPLRLSLSLLALSPTYEPHDGNVEEVTEQEESQGGEGDEVTSMHTTLPN